MRLDLLRLRQVILAAALGLLCSACAADEPPTPAPKTVGQPIVGGINEYGWQGVGALTFIWPGVGYAGSFCTGTLINSSWVLTAAHCLDQVAGVALTPQVVRFYVGTNANPGPSGWPSSGTLYETDAFYPHPSYNSSTQENDLALVHLSAPATGVPSYPLNLTPFDGGWINQTVLYVGFGVNDGVAETGSGIKRSGSNPIQTFWDFVYQSDATAGVGVCFGDSGGPGIRNISGTYHIIGVNSSVGGSTVTDPCLGHGTHTRVDAYYATFIAPVIGAPPPNCNTTPSICVCPAACQTSGSCDNTACQVLSCEGIVNCMDPCGTNDGCRIDCYLAGTNTGRTSYDDLAQCATTYCANATDYGACLMQYCMNEYYGCFPPTNCDVAGGDCGAGTACYPVQGGYTDCVTSDDVAEGMTCNPNLTGRVACADGLLCVTFSSGSRCVPMCTTATDCETGQECDMPIFVGISDIGICQCVDADNDGWCEEDDCNDNNAQTHPGAVERCNDHEDNNCDGQVDENCGACVDEDRDGYCADVDCDDGNTTINPGAAERCNDHVDNNCDGQIDENCDTCVDADGDDYCATLDCDDQDPLANPGAAERCGDNIDNDCDGQINERCDICQDYDGDGYCAEVDCEDANPEMFPGAEEICWDGLDNDCDGRIDGGCVCVDADQDGYCLGGTQDCDDADPYANPGSPEICGDQRDNDCDGLIDEGCDKGDGGCNAAGEAPSEGSVVLFLLGLALLGWRRRR